jgi:hypothetical protein
LKFGQLPNLYFINFEGNPCKIRKEIPLRGRGLSPVPGNRCKDSFSLLFPTLQSKNKQWKKFLGVFTHLPKSCWSMNQVLNREWDWAEFLTLVLSTPFFVCLSNGLDTKILWIFGNRNLVYLIQNRGYLLGLGVLFHGTVDERLARKNKIFQINR